MPIFFKLSPELGDGDHISLVDIDRTDLLAKIVKDWADEFKNSVGEGFEVEVIEMTQEELDALPEI